MDGIQLYPSLPYGTKNSCHLNLQLSTYNLESDMETFDLLVAMVLIPG